MHSVGIAQRHRPGSVPVVSALERDQLGTFRMALRVLVLHRHLRGAFHGDGARVRKKYPVQAFRQESFEALSELYRGLVRKASEHHMAHLFALASNRFDDFGRIVTVRDTPPARNGIDEF